MQEKAKEPEIRFAGFTGAWEQRKVKDLAANTYGGGTPLTSNPEFWEGSIPWIQSSDLSEHNLFRVHPRKFISHAAVANSSVKIIPENSIAVITRVGVGKLAVMSFPYTTSQDFLSLSNLNTDVKFTSYQLYRRLQKDLNAVQGTSIKGITKEELLGKNIYIPGCQEQEAIGKFFSKIDSLLTLHQRKYEKLLNIKKSMLEKMFPKEGEVVPEIRFKGFTGAWEQRKFGEMANRRSEVSASGNLPRVEYEDIVSGTGTLNKDVFEKQSQKQGIVFHSGDVLYGKLRPYLQNWLLASFNGLAVGDFWVLEPQGLNSNYLYRIIQTKQFDEIANQSVGTKMPRADWKLVSKATFLNPASFNEQRLIGKFFKDIDSLLTLHQRKLEMLKNVKQAFLEKMFV